VSWPTPSIEELTHALDTFCARKWQGDLEEVQHEAHEHTRAEVLPHRCIEAVYMVTLLRDGFGFHPSSRDIVSPWMHCISFGVYESMPLMSSLFGHRHLHNMYKEMRLNGVWDWRYKRLLRKGKSILQYNSAGRVKFELFE